ncbi:IclR family transcriptional regulator [Glaciecola sp. 1036]|uniref:IclR family transcriptional regulator n=1 Tax=Alteromonadaceae TaxID=72275 RepID=UPI003D05549A
MTANQPSEKLQSGLYEKSVVTEKSYTAPALEKGLDIIELLATLSEGLKLKEIAAQLNKSVSEIFRMVCVLEKRQYIHLDSETEKYHISIKLFEVAFGQYPVKTLSEVATKELSYLTKEIKQSAYLSVLNNESTIVTAYQESPTENHFKVGLGSSAPILDSCAGHVFVAYMDDSDYVKIQQQFGITFEPTRLENLKRVILNQGYERMLSKKIQGIEEIGFPVFDRMNRIVACLVVPFLHYLDNSNVVDINTAIQEAGLSAQRMTIALSTS